MTGVIIIGAGQAAASFVAKFRTLDQKTALTIYGDEPEIPYQRPPLSKKYATGDMVKAQLYLRPETWYSDQNIRLKTSVKVSCILHGHFLLEVYDIVGPSVVRFRHCLTHQM